MSLPRESAIFQWHPTIPHQLQHLNCTLPNNQGEKLTIVTLSNIKYNPMKLHFPVPSNAFVPPEL